MKATEILSTKRKLTDYKIFLFLKHRHKAPTQQTPEHLTEQ